MQHAQWMEQLPDAVHNWLDGRRIDDVEWTSPLQQRCLGLMM